MPIPFPFSIWLISTSFNPAELSSPINNARIHTNSPSLRRSTCLQCINQQSRRPYKKLIIKLSIKLQPTPSIKIVAYPPALSSKSRPSKSRKILIKEHILTIFYKMEPSILPSPYSKF